MVSLFLPANELRKCSRAFSLIHDEVRAIEGVILVAAELDLLDTEVCDNTTMTETTLNSFVPLTTFDLPTDTFTLIAHGLLTGDEIELQTSDQLPIPLNNVDTFFVIKIDNDNFKLATTLLNATNGVVIDLISIKGSVASITIATIGTGYALTEAIDIVGGNGAGATAEISSIGGSGEVTGITITNPGTGYTFPPTATAITVTGVGATFTTVLTASIISFRKITEAQKYFKTFKNDRIDRSRDDQMNQVIKHFENLGYVIARKTNEATNQTFCWKVSW